MIKHKNLLLVSLFTLTAISLISILSRRPIELYADTEDIVATASSWDVDHQQVSIGAPYASSPTITESTEGNTVLVVYSSASDLNDTSPQNLYYSFSNKNGEAGSWTAATTHLPLYDSEPTSSKAHVTFDQNNRAHVVWTEIKTVGSEVISTQIAYAKSVSSDLNDGFGNVTVFPNIAGAVPEASDPQVITFGTDVHIIWAESTGNTTDNNPDIYYRRSTNGGGNWGLTYDTPVPITTDLTRHKNPAVAVDDDGNLHVLYEKQAYIDPVLREQIYYAKGKLSDGNIFWAAESTHPNITEKMSNDIPDFDVVEPDILYSKGRLDASVTQRYVLPIIPSEKAQYVYHIGCDNSCEDNGSNWIPTRVSNINLFLDASPYSIVSSIVRLGSCLNIIFDGKTSIEQSNPEQIFLSSSCSNWGNNLQELTLPIGSRTIQPSAASQSNWWGYVVYEEFVGDAVNANKQVFFTRNKPAVYLPVITK